MASLNTAQIMDAGKRYGISVDNAYAQTVMNATQGGDPGQVDAYFQRNKPAPPPPPPADPLVEAEKFRQFNIKANEPYVQTLEASKDPLKSRYDNLISQITGAKQEETARTQSTVSQEYARRGIPLSSTAYNLASDQALQPINRFFVDKVGEATANQEQGIAEINNIIGQLKTGAPLESVQAALSMVQLNETVKQQAIENALAQREFNEVTLPSTQAQIGYYNAQAAKANFEATKEGRKPLGQIDQETGYSYNG